MPAWVGRVASGHVGVHGLVVAWPGGRLQAIAVSPDGSRVAAVEIPSELRGVPALWLRDGAGWQRVPTGPQPDISTRLAWLEPSRLAYESADRRLVLLDLQSGQHEVGPVGSCPVAAPDRREWYAIVGGRVMTFAWQRPFASPPAALGGFRLGQVATLRVTRDGQVLAWTEPRLALRTRGYLQFGGRRRVRFRALEQGNGAVIGPYDEIC